MKEIKIRNQSVRDAFRFCEILNNPNFVHFSVASPSLEEEIEFLKANARKRNRNFEYNYSILLNDLVIGAIGLRINQHQKFIGELGYFIDEDYWNRGYATSAVRIVEKIGFRELNLTRIEVPIIPGNTASIRVAEKCGYQKEGLLKQRLFIRNRFEDACLFAKTRDMLNISRGDASNLISA